MYVYYYFHFTDRNTYTTSIHSVHSGQCIHSLARYLLNLYYMSDLYKMLKIQLWIRHSWSCPHETYRLLRKILSNYANVNVSGDKNTLSHLLILNRIRVHFDFLPIFHTKLLPHLEFLKHILNRKLIKHLELKRDLFLFYHKENINIRLTKPCNCLLPDPSSAPACSVILAFCNHFLGLPSSL